jgi:phosphopantetheinyl transferase
MVTWLDMGRNGGPQMALIDATLEGLDEAELRTRARNLGAAVGAGKVSRSYCHPYALVAWHDGPIGVDIERFVSCPEEFAQAIATPSEEASGRWVTGDDLISLWSSKEALAKALGDALDYDPRRLESPAGWPDGVCGRWRTATLPAPHGHCAWVCWRTRHREI